jgi:hypothetical protein
MMVSGQILLYVTNLVTAFQDLTSIQYISAVSYLASGAWNSTSVQYFESYVSQVGS